MRKPHKYQSVYTLIYRFIINSNHTFTLKNALLHKLQQHALSSARKPGEQYTGLLLPRMQLQGRDGPGLYEYRPQCDQHPVQEGRTEV